MNCLEKGACAHPQLALSKLVELVGRHEGAQGAEVVVGTDEVEELVVHKVLAQLHQTVISATSFFTVSIRLKQTLKL